MFYRQFRTTLSKYDLVPEHENIQNLIKDRNTDHYVSIFKYNDAHYDRWKTTGTVSGITDPTTEKLFFDFDCANDVEAARKDACSLVSRLASFGIAPSDIQVAYSGKKGFSVELETTTTFTPEQFKATVFKLASDLSTFDKKVNDPNRIVRIVGTRHPGSGLFKIPITADELRDLSVKEIQNLAKEALIDESPPVPVRLPENVVAKLELVKPTKAIHVADIDFSMRPRWLSAPRYALQEGYFTEGNRHQAFMILAATYRQQGFNKEMAYNMLLSVADLQAERNDAEPYTEREIRTQVINSVYGPDWKGGIYKDSEEPLLLAIAEEFGLTVGKDGPSDYTPTFIGSLHQKFEDYVTNIDKNTIKTGIPSLDERVFISTGANVGILGAPASGKSALALTILNNTSKAGVKSIFASFDMSGPRMYEKMIYKLTGYERDVVYDIYKNRPEEKDKINALINDEFGNVHFFDKIASTVEDIERYLVECNEQAASPEDKVKLIVVDYFERVNVDMSEDTAASKKVAGQLQDLVNKYNIAIITLVQPNKISGDLSEPIRSYTNIKGSSYLAQSFRIVLGIFREGFSLMDADRDRFLTMNVLKNDLGETGSIDFYWNGKRGEISEIDDAGMRELKEIRAANEAGKEFFG